MPSNFGGAARLLLAEQPFLDHVEVGGTVGEVLLMEGVGVKFKTLLVLKTKMVASTLISLAVSQETSLLSQNLLC